MVHVQQVFTEKLNVDIVRLELEMNPFTSTAPPTGQSDMLSSLLQDKTAEKIKSIEKALTDADLTLDLDVDDIQFEKEESESKSP